MDEHKLDSSLIRKPLKRSMAWALCTELARRHPEMDIREEHPGGGMYDCLVLRTSGEGSASHLSCNLEGSIHFHRADSFDSTDWRFVLSQDPYDAVRAVEVQLGLVPPKEIPVTTPKVLTYRVMSAMMTSSTFARTPRELVSGFCDTSGYGEGSRDFLFEEFRAIPHQLRAVKPSDPFGAGEYRFWFLFDGEEARLAFEISEGTVFRRDEQDTFDLVRGYDAAGRSLPLLLAELTRWCGLR